MAFQRYRTASKPITGTPCIHLRSKAIYVIGKIRNPDHPDEEGSHYCWCNMTQHVLGPDKNCVDQHQCVEGRGCFRSSYA